MASLNINDEWFTPEEPRRGKLQAEIIAELLSHGIAPQRAMRMAEFQADGMATAAWRLSRVFWRKGRKLIPEEDWARADLEPVIRAGLAERSPEGIFVRGADKHHEWCVKEIRAAAGRAGGQKSAQVRKERTGSAVPANATNAQRVGNNAEAKPKQNRSKTEANRETPKQTPKQNDENRSKPEATPKQTEGFILSSESTSSCHKARDREITHTSANVGSPTAEPPDAPAEKGKSYRYADDDLQAATWLQRQVKRLNPDARRVDGANLEAWANDFRLMRERDQLSHDQISAVLEFALTDDFWSANIQCPKKLREKWDTLTGQMKRQRRSGGGF